jgi:ribosome maturation factor RimP
MNQAPERVHKVVAPIVESLGYELVGIEYIQAKGGLLRVYIDSPEGIKIEDCQAVSEQLSATLDVEDPITGNYTLEVSSPGLDRPLFTAEQFERFAGQQVKISVMAPVNGQRKFTGLLKGIRGNGVVLAVGDEEVCLPLDDIQQARLVPRFD